MIVKIGLKELVRRIYIIFAKIFTKCFLGDATQAVWLRRSSINEDFYPLTSDIDLTVLINDKQISKTFKYSSIRGNFIIKDIQFISSRFFKSWIQAGGFRNRQIHQWKQICGESINFKDSIHISSAKLAFELAYEIHLLYKQLVHKMLENGTCSGKIFSQNKLLKEIERVRQFWFSRDIKWITKPRTEIPISGLCLQEIKKLNQLCEDLLNNIESPMNNYDWESSIKYTLTDGFILDIQIDGMSVFIPHDFSQFEVLLFKYHDKYVASSSYIKLIKGVGIQEQSHLNTLAKTDNFYRNFCIQRLAHDLLGAILMEPENLRQLYYCFYNIQEFYKKLTNENLPNWDEIDTYWQKKQELPFNMKGLLSESQSKLDLLESFL